MTDRGFRIVRRGRVTTGVMLVLLAAGVAGVVGCSSDPVTAPRQQSPDVVLGRAIVAPRVSVIAIGGTVQLSLVATSLAGTPLTDVDSVWYRLNSPSDTVRVRLDSTGVVTGRAVSMSPVLVNVFVFRNGTIKADQALVQVTSTVIPGVVLSIQPAPTDSTRLASGTVKTIVPILKNPTTGSAVSNPVMRYAVRPEDADKLGVYTPALRLPNGPYVQVTPYPSPSVGTNQIVPRLSEGQVWVYAETNAYGTVLRDSVLYTFTYPYAYTLTASQFGYALTSDFAGATVTLMHGAILTLANSLPNPSTVAFTFDNPSVAAAATVGGDSGNAPAVGQNARTTRRLTTPGTYHVTVSVPDSVPTVGGQSFSGTLVVK